MQGLQRKVKELDQIDLQPTWCMQLHLISGNITNKERVALILLPHRPVTVIITALFHT